jgi:hypothetical protein
MIVYDLVCSRAHRFEGWFASAGDFALQHEATLIRCPVCDDAVIERRLSANVQTARPTAAQPPAEAESKEPLNVAGGEAEALKLVRRLIANSDDVGAAFAEEARKIHYEEVPKRSIRGQATREEADELRDEGIDFMSLPNILTRNLN